MDATDEESVKAAARHVGGIDGKLDILLSSAGFAASRRDPDFFTKKLSANEPFEPETVQNWADMFALNTITPFFVVRAFQSLLIKGALSRPQGTSSVINISSVAANLQSSASGLPVSCLRVNESRLEPSHPSSGTSFATIRDIPICVNAISPGPFASEMAPPGFLELLLKTAIMPGLVQVPARRHGSEAEMGITVVLLAVSNYTNRVILRVDGLSSVNP
ncbi:uncharacterized protein ARMOST_06574 [Armillaria ostoyae]|uniref:NAD(P)-binding protein n=1 Tax=Armillaria ostoyae TaxID=47428 RepID=A0A284R3F1_ARMOS|nr:uncharacterized protein ARMOST_06574 [Armillaria ostoyae]